MNTEHGNVDPKDNSMDPKGPQSGLSCGEIFFSSTLPTLLTLAIAHDFDEIDSIVVADTSADNPAIGLGAVKATLEFMGRLHGALKNREDRTEPNNCSEHEPLLSGPHQIWFPAPFGPLDCYRTHNAELVQRFHHLIPNLERISILGPRKKPAPTISISTGEGNEEAIFVEIRGLFKGAYRTEVIAATAIPQQLKAAAGSIYIDQLFSTTNVTQSSLSSPMSGSVTRKRYKNQQTATKFLIELTQFVRIWRYTGDAHQRNPTNTHSRSRVASKGVILRRLNGS